MLNIICMITVTVMVNLDKEKFIPWMVQTQAHGHVISENDESYLVNFNKEAAEKGWVGDYSEQLVQKSVCMKLNEK